jgi:hypothetical protein
VPAVVGRLVVASTVVVMSAAVVSVAPMRAGDRRPGKAQRHDHESRQRDDDVETSPHVLLLTP